MKIYLKNKKVPLTPEQEKEFWRLSRQDCKHLWRFILRREKHNLKLPAYLKQIIIERTKGEKHETID